MPFTTDTSLIKDRTEHFPPTEDGLMNDRLHSLTWFLLAVGQGQIKEKNVDEVWVRVQLWQKAVGPMFSRFEVGKDPEPIVVTKDDVVNAIGLHTNVSNLSRTAFLKKLWDAVEGPR
jgi:hypothetical protein